MLIFLVVFGPEKVLFGLVFVFPFRSQLLPRLTIVLKNADSLSQFKNSSVRNNCFNQTAEKLQFCKNYFRFYSIERLVEQKFILVLFSMGNNKIAFNHWAWHSEIVILVSSNEKVVFCHCPLVPLHSSLIKNLSFFYPNYKSSRRFFSSFFCQRQMEIWEWWGNGNWHWLIGIVDQISVFIKQKFFIIVLLKVNTILYSLNSRVENIMFD